MAEAAPSPSTTPTTGQPPVAPLPQPYTANVLRRLRRGLRSWFALLNEWDFRVPLGQINVLGRPLFLVNDPPLADTTPPPYDDLGLEKPATLIRPGLAVR